MVCTPNNLLKRQRVQLGIVRELVVHSFAQRVFSALQFRLFLDTRLVRVCGLWFPFRVHVVKADSPFVRLFTWNFRLFLWLWLLWQCILQLAIIVVCAGSVFAVAGRTNFIRRLAKVDLVPVGTQIAKKKHTNTHTHLPAR